MKRITPISEVASKVIKCLLSYLIYNIWQLLLFLREENINWLIEAGKKNIIYFPERHINNNEVKLLVYVICGKSYKGPIKNCKDSIYWIKHIKDSIKNICRKAYKGLH